MADEPITITQAQLDTFQRGMGLLDKLLSDPKKSMEFKKMAKEVDATLKFPELDIVALATEPVKAELEAIKNENKTLLERFEAAERARADKDGLTELEGRIAAAKKLYGLTDEGVAKAIERMKSINSTDVEGAFAKIAADNPPAKPTTGNSYAPSSLNLFGTGEVSEDVSADGMTKSERDLLHTNPLKFFDTKTADILNNPQNYPELAA